MSTWTVRRHVRSPGCKMLLIQVCLTLVLPSKRGLHGREPIFFQGTFLFEGPFSRVRSVLRTHAFPVPEETWMPRSTSCVSCTVVQLKDLGPADSAALGEGRYQGNQRLTSICLGPKGNIMGAGAEGGEGEGALNKALLSSIGAIPSLLLTLQ